MAFNGLATADREDTPSAPKSENSASTELAAPAPDETVLAPIERYRVIIERPLFTVDRRPSLSETSQIAQSTNFVLSLTGIIVEGQERQAVFRHPDQPRPVRMTVGETQQGWELLRIHDDHVVLQKDTRSLRLTLDYSRPSAGGPSATPTPGTTGASTAGATSKTE